MTASYTDAASGMLALSGSTLVTTRYTDAASVALVLSGNTFEACAYNTSLHGVLSRTGTLVEDIAHTIAPSGSVSIRSSVRAQYIFNDIGAGALSLFGSLTHTYVETPKGRLSLLGAKTEDWITDVDVNGDLPVRGFLNGINTETVAGSIAFLGSVAEAWVTSNPSKLIPLDPPVYTDVRQYVDIAVPWDIQRQRRSNLEVMKRMGTPVLLKRMYTIEDVENGIAQESPTFDDIYGQSTYATDDLSNGVGFVSVEIEPTEWYDPATGVLYSNPVPPDSTYLQAPRYRGYGPGYLTYCMLPDRPEDAWKLTPQGTLIRQQTAMAQLSWWPQVRDNDLLITCRLDDAGHIAQTYERYQLKMVTPITMRGLDRHGDREFEVNAGGNRFWVGQQCEATKVPTNDQLYKVDVDR